MARLASKADLVNVMYEQVDALRRKIGVAPIRLSQLEGDPPGLKVSVIPGTSDKVPVSVTMRVRGEEVHIPLTAIEDYR